MSSSVSKSIFGKRISSIGRRADCLGWLVCVLLSAGCGSAPNGAERFVPNPERASAALTAAMKAWQQGKGPGLLSDVSPPLHVMDSQRRPGQKLEEFEILGEVPGETARCYAVRLKFSHPEAEEKARYLVLGIDPLWVFRHEDYELLAHWDHPMPADSKPAVKKAGEEQPQK